MATFSLDLLKEILSYIDDARTLGRLACSSRSLSDIASRSVLWNCLGRLRWPYTWKDLEDDNGMNAKRYYHARLIKDIEACAWMKVTVHASGFGPGYVVEQPPRYVADPDVYDFMLSAAVPSAVHSGKSAGEFSFNEMCLASEVFIRLHFRQVMQQLLDTVIMNQRSLPDNVVLEEGAWILSMSLWNAGDLDSTPSAKFTAFSSEMDQISERVMEQLSGVDRPLDRALTACQALAQEFFSNSDNYYDVLNSSIEKIVRENKKGIPITLAVLYKCILRRLDIDADIIGLPCHVVLGLSGDTFVDVFNGAQVLSAEGCQAIVASYGINWEDEFLRPLRAHDVVNRMINNIYSCQSQRPTDEIMFTLYLMQNPIRQIISAWPVSSIFMDPTTFLAVRNRNRRKLHCLGLKHE